MTRRSNNPFFINDDTQELICVDIRYRVHYECLTNEEKKLLEENHK